MMERTTTKTVVFHHPFAVGAVDGLLPPGSYVVETDEELIPGISFLAYRRVRTTMILPIAFGVAGARQVVTIDPQELEVALVRDAESVARAEHSRGQNG
jgi:hypothetical protein